MLSGKRICVVMPAYNAAATLRKTLDEIDRTVVDEIIVVDDASQDGTVEMARGLGLHTLVHPRNRGYGGNQKTCYTASLRTGADVVIMLHPDYQYTPRIIPAMASLICADQFDVVLGSRILSGGARRGGMPLYKYVANRALTAFENVLTGAKLSEYHTGYRAFARAVLERLPLHENSDDFVFDAQMLAQCIYFGYRIGEITCPTRYAVDSSSLDFRRSLRYGLGVVGVSLQFRAARLGVLHPSLFDPGGRRLPATA